MVFSGAVRRLFAVFFGFALLFVASAARADWQPPPLNGHVVDQAGALSPSESHALDMKLDQARQQTGFAIVIFILPSLPDGLTIEDVGYKAGNTWGVGSAKGDDGVLLINSVAEHRLRIETGKGVGGALTDVDSSHINREVIGPLLKQGRTYDAMNAGTDAILQTLTSGTPGGKSAPGQGAQRRAGGSAVEQASGSDLIHMGMWIAIIIGVIGLAIYSPTFRTILFFSFLSGGRRGRDDDDWGGGGGGGGGSGYGGGGGSFGGGGSSDSY